jgi:hypothetical protein
MPPSGAGRMSVKKDELLLSEHNAAARVVSQAWLMHLKTSNILASIFEARLRIQDKS